MRSEATARLDPPPHNKYGKSQVHKTRNDLIDTISKVIYTSWLCLPFNYTFWTGSLSIVSFIAVRVKSAPFCFKGPGEALKCSQIPSPRMLLLYSVFHTRFLGPSHPLSAFPEEEMPATQQGRLFPAQSSAHLLFQPGNRACHTNPGPGQSHLPGSLPKPCLGTSQAIGLGTVPTMAPFQG